MNHPSPTAPMTAPFPRPLRLLIGFLFIVILLDENKNHTGLKLECEFKNINGNFDICNYDDLLNGYLQTTYLVSFVALFEFTDSSPESREQLDLKCFMCCFISNNVNEILYDNEYSDILLSIRPSDIPHRAAIILNSNGIDSGISEINILERMFGVYLCESAIINEIYNDMIVGMWFFFVVNFFSVVLCNLVNLDHLNLYLYDQSLYVHF